MAVAGVTESNFDTLKTELTDVFATSVGVPSSSVGLSLMDSTVASRSTGTVIVATIKSSNANTVDAVKSSIGSGSFKETLNDEISNSETLKASGVVMNAVSEPKVVMTNIEDDGIGSGKVYINKTLKADPIKTPILILVSSLFLYILYICRISWRLCHIICGKMQRVLTN